METFEYVGNPENKEPMEKYMKNHFPFLGVKAPDRKAQSKEWLKHSKALDLSELFDLVSANYQRLEREYQYLAIDLCEVNVKRMTWSDLRKYMPLIKEKSWWDSVDSWRKIFGLYIKKNPQDKEKVFDAFFKEDNMWMRRVTINLQLMEKENTNLEMLVKAIERDLKTDEFFIQKAIGWSLRQYAKVEPQWVMDYVNQRDLTPFAKKEALKNIEKYL